MAKSDATGQPDKPYDNGLKRILTGCSQDFLDWCVPGAVSTGKFSEEFQSLTIEADAMQEALWSDEKMLVHIEGQSGPDEDMPRRLLEYFVLAYRRYGCPIVSKVIYLRRSGDLPEPPLVITTPDGKNRLYFDYEVVALYDVPYEELLAKNLRGLLPLVPLAKGGAEREVVEEIIKRLLPAHDTISKELLALTRLFAALAFTRERPEDLLWLKRRFAMLSDILRESPAFQDILEEGIEEGIEGERQRRLLSLRQKLLELVQARYPSLKALASKQIEAVEAPEFLEDLMLKLALTRTIKAARQCLRSD